jgi:hypothetical protein
MRLKIKNIATSRIRKKQLEKRLTTLLYTRKEHCFCTTIVPENVKSSGNVEIGMGKNERREMDDSDRKNRKTSGAAGKKSPTPQPLTRLF